MKEEMCVHMRDSTSIAYKIQPDHTYKDYKNIVKQLRYLLSNVRLRLRFWLDIESVQDVLSMVACSCHYQVPNSLFDFMLYCITICILCHISIQHNHV